MHNPTHRQEKPPTRLSRYAAKKRQPKTFREIFMGRLTPRILSLALFTLVSTQGALLSGLGVYGFLEIGEGAGQKPKASGEQFPKAVRAYMKNNTCWRVNAVNPPPAETVIYSAQETKNKIVVGGEKPTGKALDQIFAEKPAGYSIYRFCSVDEKR